ncbi:hypothetical protein V7159_00730, partial [Priestia megaterium]|uniref:hypothetical protein n=1 Tax=Priestia megaterium TaxID=1404 RepID=UPI003009F51C
NTQLTPKTRFNYIIIQKIKRFYVGTKIACTVYEEYKRKEQYVVADKEAAFKERDVCLKLLFHNEGEKKDE